MQIPKNILKKKQQKCDRNNISTTALKQHVLANYRIDKQDTSVLPAKFPTRIALAWVKGTNLGSAYSQMYGIFYRQKTDWQNKKSLADSVFFAKLFNFYEEGKETFQSYLYYVTFLNFSTKYLPQR